MNSETQVIDSVEETEEETCTSYRNVTRLRSVSFKGEMKSGAKAGFFELKSWVCFRAGVDPSRREKRP